MRVKRLTLIPPAFCVILVLAALFPDILRAQSNRITGRIADQNEKTPLPNAVISIISAKDSILTKFARSDSKGSFSISLPDEGRYNLMITYPGYADYIDQFSVKRDSAVSLNEIRLIRKSELLESVIVKQQLSAIKVKGDTLEYRADSFLVNKGASVAELLKRLPGIQVDKSGNITAQGQKVNKVLVDGEEFFSDDPAMVTQNLAADYVKDVQVYDKKSEQAEFTGIDDGERSRTINLKLKPEKKKGYFGKANIGGGTGGKFDNSIMANSFKGSRKLSAYGIASNTDRSSLDWQDRQKFGASETTQYDEENGYFMFTGSVDDQFSGDMYSDEGLPTTWTGGVHYSDNWNDIHKLNADYRILKRNLASGSSTVSQYILPDTQYFNSQSKKAFSTRIKNALYGTYDVKFDSTTSFKLTTGASRLNTTTASLFNSRALNGDSGLVNENSRTLNSDATKDHLFANGLLRKKFAKKGRTLSVNFTGEVNNESLDGFLKSNTDYYSSGSMYKNELIDQKKDNVSHTSFFSSKITYTEPLSKIVFLSLNYGLGLNQNSVHRNTFNKDPGGDGYKFRDSLYSNDFKYNYVTNSGGADIKINTKKVLYTFGGTSSYAAFNQTDLGRDSGSRYSFVNFYPKATIRYNIAPQKQLAFRYVGETNQPDPGQLQPVRQNTDPLNIQVGNPALRQEFNHSFSLSYFSYKVLSGRNIYASVYSNIRDNAISMASNVDTGGKNTYQYINLKGNSNVNFNFGTGWKSKKLGFDPGFFGNVSLGRATNMVNGLQNVNNNQTFQFGVRANKYVENKYNFSVSPNLQYTYSRSSLRPDVVTKYFTFETYADVWVQLPWKMYIGTNLQINVRQKTDVFDVNRNVVKWDARGGKKFAKNDRAEIVFSVNDILDQNIGFSRTANSNVITQNTYNTLRRFGMLSFIYNLSKTP